MQQQGTASYSLNPAPGTSRSVSASWHCLPWPRRRLQQRGCRGKRAFHIPRRRLEALATCHLHTAFKTGNLPCAHGIAAAAKRKRAAALLTLDRVCKVYRAVQQLEGRAKRNRRDEETEGHVCGDVCARKGRRGCLWDK